MNVVLIRQNVTVSEGIFSHGGILFLNIRLEVINHSSQ